VEQQMSFAWYRPRALTVRSPHAPDAFVKPAWGRPRAPTSKENHAMKLAYLDAASGSMLVQAIVAGAAGAAVFLKLFWRRLTGVFRRKEATTSQATSATRQTVASKGDER
jgi:hypothetical protein